jgi:putative transposase
MYMVAILDWFSRYVVSWTVSTTQDMLFCLDALELALRRGRPEIFNSDQESQFTSRVFTDLLKAHRIRMSMDGRGRVFDNIFTERYWRTLQYEEVYLHEYQRSGRANTGLAGMSSFIIIKDCISRSMTKHLLKSIFDRTTKIKKPVTIEEKEVN